MVRCTIHLTSSCIWNAFKKSIHSYLIIDSGLSDLIYQIEEFTVTDCTCPLSNVHFIPMFLHDACLNLSFLVWGMIYFAKCEKSHQNQIVLVQVPG